MQHPANFSLNQSLLAFSDQNPAPGLSFLRIEPHFDKIAVYYVTDYAYSTQNDPVPYRFYRGAAATALWQFLNVNQCLKYWEPLTWNEHNLLGQAYPMALRHDARLFADFSVAQMEGLFRCLKRAVALRRLLKPQVPTLLPSQIVAYAQAFAAHLNDSVERLLTTYEEPPQRQYFPFRQDTFGDHLPVQRWNELTAELLRPFAVAGLWFDLRNQDVSVPLRASIAFDDTWVAGSRNDGARTKHFSLEVKLFAGIDQLQVSPSHRSWILAKGSAWTNDGLVRFVPLADIPTAE